MTRKRANVTPEDVGKPYLVEDGTADIYRLIACEAEPMATMQNLTTEESITKPVSEFQDFVRLVKQVKRGRAKPPEPIKSRKTRKDAGTHRHGKSQPQTDVILGSNLSLPDLTKIEFKVPEPGIDPPDIRAFYNLALGEFGTASISIKGCILALFAHYNMVEVDKIREYIKNSPYFPEQEGFLEALEDAPE